MPDWQPVYEVDQPDPAPLCDNGDDCIDWEDDDDYADESCPACGGPPVVLGDLGAVTRCRCRDCGIEYHAPA